MKLFRYIRWRIRWWRWMREVPPWYTKVLPGVSKEERKAMWAKWNIEHALREPKVHD